MSDLNGRQEAFCRNYVSGMSGTAAAIDAGYERSSAAGQASRLLDRPNVAARITELRKEVADQYCKSTEDILAKLEGLYRRAVNSGEWSVAARIVTMQARVAGVDRSIGRKQIVSPSPLEEPQKMPRKANECA